MSIRNLEFALKPRSVALIGASKRPGSVGAVLARNLFKAGFDGPIMPVNPKYQAIEGVLTYPSIEALPLVPNLAVISTPPETVPRARRHDREGARYLADAPHDRVLPRAWDRRDLWRCAV